MNREQEEAWRKTIQAETIEHNCVAKLAIDDGRDYITPEDITEAFKTNSEDKVRLDVLEVMGNTSGFGWEDATLCAFVAHQGKTEDEED